MEQTQFFFVVHAKKIKNKMCLDLFEGSYSILHDVIKQGANCLELES